MDYVYLDFAKSFDEGAHDRLLVKTKKSRLISLGGGKMEIFEWMSDERSAARIHLGTYVVLGLR